MSLHEIIQAVVCRDKGIVFAQGPVVKVAGLITDHTVLHVDGHGYLIVFEFARYIRSLRQLDLSSAERKISA